MCHKCLINYLPDVSSICVLSSLTNCTIVKSNDSLRCEICQEGYLPDINSICAPIIANCITVKNNDGFFTCNECDKGFFISNNGQACQDCDEKCVTCENSNKNCLVCKDPSHMNIELGCECLPGMFFDEISSCIACDVNCTTCSGISTNCLKCKSQYYLKNNGIYNTCVACEDLSQGPPPEYLCGNITEKSCSNSKIGYNLEFENGVIFVNFASNLTKALQKKIFRIVLSNGKNYDTGNCVLEMKSYSSYEIHTDLRECDLPIFVDLRFAALN